MPEAWDGPFCDETGERAVAGTCPVHGGDACLKMRGDKPAYDPAAADDLVALPGGDVTDAPEPDPFPPLAKPYDGTPAEALRAGWCPYCLGTGRVHRSVPVSDVYPCSTCAGTGRWDA